MRDDGKKWDAVWMVAIPKVDEANLHAICMGVGPRHGLGMRYSCV
jgi:hypothetical protein